MKHLALYLPAVMFVVTCVLLVVYDESLHHLETMIDGHSTYSYILFVSLLVIATVFMPVTVMPLIPMASMVFGPFVTALLSIAGWTIGALIAFLVSRYLGRPLLERLFSLDRIDSLTASFPVETRFLYIVLLRLTIPVDIASYALGLVKGVKLKEYIVATLIGVTWFSFAFAYLGDALLTGNTPLGLAFGGGSLLVFVSAWLILRHNIERNK